MPQLTLADARSHLLVYNEDAGQSTLYEISATGMTVHTSRGMFTLFEEDGMVVRRQKPISQAEGPQIFGKLCFETICISTSTKQGDHD